MSNPGYSARKQAARANRDFYAAIEALDADAMERLWLQDERVQCIHPGWGLLIGHAKVLESWRSIFRSSSGIRFELTDLSVEVIGELAWATCIEHIHSQVDGQPVEGRAVATNLFQRHDGQWKMLLHHASPVLRRE